MVQSVTQMAPLARLGQPEDGAGQFICFVFLNLILLQEKC